MILKDTVTAKAVDVNVACKIRFNYWIAKLTTLNEQREFIERLVKLNNKFVGNEDLLEDFCSETYKRSYSLFESVDPMGLESYIAKVVNTSVLTVLRENGRVRRRENKYVSTNDIFVTNQSSQIESFVYNMPDPRDSFEEKIVRKDLLQKIVDIVLVAQKNSPAKEFLRIFYLRYIKELKQKEIAEEVNISQAEVSKRLIELAQIVKSHFNH